MDIVIPKPSEKALEKNGWELITADDYKWYHKKINNLHVEITRVTESRYECEILDCQDIALDDLIAIGNELKKLEEN